MKDVTELSGGKQKRCFSRMAMCVSRHGDGVSEVFAMHSWAPSVCGAGKAVALHESRFYVV